MLILQIFILIILLMIAFWQASLIYAQKLGAPSVNSSQEAIIEALKLANLKKGQTVVDLGCGNGQTLILAATHFGARGVGVERSPFYYLAAKLNIIVHGRSKNISIVFGDFASLESILKTTDVVYLYLFPRLLSQIESWLFSNINPAARVVSLAFSFHSHAPVKTITAKNLGLSTKIELYTK